MPLEIRARKEFEPQTDDVQKPSFSRQFPGFARRGPADIPSCRWRYARLRRRVTGRRALTKMVSPSLFW